jgi:hypothetical protein
MSHSQFHSTKLFILRHAWLNLWDKHMTTGRINQVTLVEKRTWNTTWSDQGGGSLPFPLPSTIFSIPLLVTHCSKSRTEGSVLCLVEWPIKLLTQLAVKSSWHLKNTMIITLSFVVVCYHPIASLSFFLEQGIAKKRKPVYFAKPVLRWKFQLSSHTVSGGYWSEGCSRVVLYDLFSWRINTHEFFFR